MLSYILITLVLVQFIVLQACVYQNLVIVVPMIPIVVKAVKLVHAGVSPFLVL
jgi:hypothetical protein